MNDRKGPEVVGDQLSLSPHDQQVYAAGYIEAARDRAGDADTIAQQAAEIRRLQAELRTAKNDLDRVRRTAAALEKEAAGFFTELQHAGHFDDELAERKAVYRAREAEQQAAMIARACDGRPEYCGGPVEW